MQGCQDVPQGAPRVAFPSLRDAGDLRAIIAAIDGDFEAPLAAIRVLLGGAGDRLSVDEATGQHLASVLQMCDDVATLSRRYLDTIDQVEALPAACFEAVRPDELLAELDRRVLPEALDRGVAWHCGAEGVIRPIRTDAILCLEALYELAALAVGSASTGDSVTLVGVGRDGPVLTLESTAKDVIAELSTLLEDPLFGRSLCLEEVGSDPGSRFALVVERLKLLGTSLDFEASADGPVRRLRIRFPTVERNADRR